MQHIFIIGLKGLPDCYETFVDKLIECHENNKKDKYNVACNSTQISPYECYNAHCFNVRVPNIGSAQDIYNDVVALQYCYLYISKNKIEYPIVYILACRIGAVTGFLKKIIHNFEGLVLANPDGKHVIMDSTDESPVKSRLLGTYIVHRDSRSTQFNSSLRHQKRNSLCTAVLAVA